MADIWGESDKPVKTASNQEQAWGEGDSAVPASALRKVGDLGLSVAKGVVAVPEALVGLADIPTGGRVGKFLENEGGAFGFRPKQAKEYLAGLQSDDLRDKQQQFQKADGIIDKAGVALANPSLITNAVAESAPLIGGGAVPARALLAVAPRMGSAAAGALGEGVVGTGSAAEGIRQETADGLLTPGQSGLALASGAATAGFGFAGGKLAQRLGIGDVDTMIAQGSRGMAEEAVSAAARAATNPLVQQQAMKGIPRRVIEGAISEGFLEELPQSVAEQVFHNVALGKDWLQDVDAAAVMGVLSGGVMGGAASGYHGMRQPASRADGLQPPEQATAQPAPQPSPALQRIQLAYAEQLSALQALEQGEPGVPQTTPPDGAAVLAQQQAEEAARRQAAQEASRAVASPDDEIFQSTGAAVDPEREQVASAAAQGGALSSAALTAIDSGAAGQMQQAQAAEQAAKGGKKPAKATQIQEQQTQAQQDIDTETGEILTGMSRWSDEQLSQAFRGAQSRDVRMQMARELSRRRAEREQQALRAELDAEQRGTVLGAERVDAAFASLSEDAGPVPADLSIPTTQQGPSDGTQVSETQQTAPKPAKTGAAPRSTAERAPLEGGPGAAGEVLQGAAGVGRATSQNTGAQDPPAPGAQAAQAGAETTEQRAQRVASAGEAWTRMPASERAALSARADGLNPIQRKRVPSAAWANLNVSIQRKLADAMAPAASPAIASLEPVDSLHNPGKPDPRNSAAMDELEGFKPGEAVEVQGRTIGPSTVELVFRRQMAGLGVQPMARVVGANGKKLDVLLSELTRAEQKSEAPAQADPAQEKPNADSSTIVGRRADGVMIRQDMNGVRWYAKDGVRHFESVSMRPTRQGMQVERGELKAEFMTAAESEAAKPAASPAPAAESTLDVSAEKQAGTSTKETPFAMNSVAKKALAAANKPSADQTRAKADLMNALADLGDILGKSARMNIVPEQEQKLLPVLTRVLDAAFRLGYHKFKDSAKFALDQIREHLGADAADALTLDHLQGAYIAMAGGKQGADSKRTVIDVESKDDIEVHDAVTVVSEPDTMDAPVEGTAPTGAENEHSDVPVESPQALDEVAATEGGESQSGRRAGAGAADRREGNRQDGDRADGAGVPAARSGGSRTGRIRPAQTGARGKSGTVGAQGTGDAGAPASAADGRVAVPGGAASAPNIPAADFRITDEVALGKGGEVQKFNDNLAAIRALKQIEAENRRATPDEQAALARYVGWGGLANAFPDPISGEFKDKWKARGEELRELLTDAEYKAARRSTRNAHYTSQTIVTGIWDAVRRLGYRGGLVLESSMGSGNFLGLAPANLAHRFVGVEYDSLTARIAQALYPQATVLHSGFQSVPVPDNAFMLNIGNPPFGSESLRFQFKPELQGVSIHNQFFRAGMDALRPGGLQAMVVSRFLMDAKDKSSRLAMASKAKLIAAIRLPDTAFKENARTEVVTDILIFQKLEPGEQAAMEVAVEEYRKLQAKAKDADAQAAALVPAWVETVEMKDPLGGDPMTVNAYFQQNPSHVLGVLERSGSMQHGADITVRLDNPAELGERLAAVVATLPENVQNIEQEVMDATAARHRTMSDALRIALAAEEVGHVKTTPDGKLQRVIERETPEGDYEFAYQDIDENSPWSESLSQDAEGRWYELLEARDEQGQKVKVLGKDGKPTKRNLYERKVFADVSEISPRKLLGKTGLQRLTGLVKLRDLLKRQLTLETADAAKVVMEGNRKALAAAYAEFIKANGPVNRSANMALAMTMPDGGLVAALEVGYQPERTAAQAASSGLPEQSEVAKPAPILRERVVPKYEPATKAATASDALAITLSERGRVDMERIAALLGVSEEAAAEQLQDGADPLVFKDPESGAWETADVYLSGMVKRKLNAARAASLAKNVQALEKVIPEDWTAENVQATMGATWVPPDVYAAFLEHLAGGKAKVSFSSLTNSFSVTAGNTDPSKSNQWSSEGAPVDYIVTRILNSKPVTVTAKDADGNIYVDKERTALAGLKAREIVAEFGDWVFKDGERRQRLVQLFNEKFNTRVVRQYNGQHLALPGKVPDAIIKMRRHQLNAIWRGIYERFMLVDHAVGAGKTFTAIARAMERRRMGLSRKPMIVVPNHLVEQWEADVYRLYPGAKVLAAGKSDFEAKRRRRLFGKIATGDWDIVIVPHSSFGFIGISQETESRYLELEMAQAQAAIEDAWKQAQEDGTDNGRRKPFGVKEAERLAEKIQARMDRLKEGVRDRLLTFEQMGVDDLTVDEAHEFKNLYYSSNLTGVRGMGDKTGSRKANDLYNKVRVLTEQPTATVSFLTGTPISNSAVEMFTMLRYLAADSLEEMGLTHFDAFRTQFVEATPAFEPTESGRLKQVTRLGRTWSNMRSLMDLYYQVTDAVSLEDIKRFYAEDNPGQSFPVPKVAGGKDRRLIAIKPTPAQEQELISVMSGFDGLEDIEDPYERNAERLRLMDRARKVSLDVRAVNPRNPSAEEGGKLQRVSQEVKRIYDKWDADKGTQLIFLDRSVPKSKGDDAIIKAYDALVLQRDAALAKDDQEGYQEAQEALDRYDPSEIAELRMAQASPWNAYQQIKDNLVAMGIPADEIRFVQEAANDEQKAALFDAVNGGKVRVLLGSTPRMGAGTNVQKRAVALHHVDVTWKPSDIEQREGRVVRQGNELLAKHGDSFEVEILAYATERTVDAKMWDLNATKLRTINGIRKYQGAFTMEFDDEEAVGMAEMAALASGNPLLLERVQTESEIQTLEMLERAHRRKMWGVADALDSARRAIARNPEMIERSRQRTEDVRARIGVVDEAAHKRSVTVEGERFSEQSDALRAAEAAIKLQQEGNDKARFAITIDGERVSSKDAVSAAIGAALGDVDTFEATVNGKRVLQRTAAAREIAALANEQHHDKDGAKVVPLGSLYGYELVADIDFATVKGDRVKNLRLSLMDGEKTIASDDANEVPSQVQYTATNIRAPLERLVDRVRGMASGTDVDFLSRQLERAKRDLPALEARTGEGFPKATELAAKRARLKELVSLLDSGRPAAPVSADSPSDDGSQPAGPVLYSRATDSVPQSVAEWLPDTVIADEVEKRIGGFAQQPPVRIRDTAFGQLPGVARNDNVAGAVHDGAIYLFRDQLGDRAAVQRTLFHELFHYGLRKFLTKEQFTGQMMNLYRRDRAIKEEADRWAATADGLRAKEFGGDEYALARGVDEALAILAEPNGGPHLNQTARAMLVRRVTNWLADVAQFLKMDEAAAHLRSMHNSEAREYIQSVFQRLERDEGGRSVNWANPEEAAFAKTTASLPAAGHLASSESLLDANQARTQSIVDAIAAGWTRKPADILVVRNMQDAQVPQRVREHDAALKSQGATGEPRGFIYQGKVYLLSDQLHGAEQVTEVLFHEVLGHYGLQGAFGVGLKPILQQLATMRRALVEAKAQEYGLDMSDEEQRLQAAEEVLAEMAQTRPEIGFVQRAIAAIRNWLRAHVPGLQTMSLTDADVIQAYILPARGWVERGRKAKTAGVMPMFQRAYHGTPHRGIEKFSTDKIGTGEGAQAYGWGLYFASKREIADHYRRKLSGDGAMLDGIPMSRMPWYYANLVDDIRNGKDFYQSKAVAISIAQELLQRAQRDLAAGKRWAAQAYVAELEGHVAALQRMTEDSYEERENFGQLYEVEIPEDSEMLLWDRPLSEQPEKARKALESRNLLSSRMTGEQLYKHLKANPSHFDGLLSGSALTQAHIYPDQGASMFLSALGIKGIKYLDGDSRNAGEGSYNYVIFTGDDVAIERAHFQRDNVQGPDSSAEQTAGEKALAAFAQADELFALPKSTKDTVEGIAADNDAQFTISRPVNIGGRLEYTFTLPDGTKATLSVRDPNPFGGVQVYDARYTDDGMELVPGRPGENPDDVPPTGDVWIDVSDLKKGDFGAKMYNIAATYAHNTGRIFIGDPHGLSKDALRRRLEQMISSALKFGTTAHLAPHPDQTRGGHGVPPLRWVYGDHVGNVERMIAASVKALDNGFPQSKLIEYRDGNFYNANNGKLLPRGRLATGLGESIAQRRSVPGAEGSTAQAGWRTVARAALFRHFQSSIRDAASGIPQRGSLLARGGKDVSRLERREAGEGAFDANERIFYSRARGVSAGGHRATLTHFAATAREELSRTFAAPGKLSWWHKTVGTMYNLAERSSVFKRVYESAQGFVDDVSYYATDAAELAPKLLPKLENWRDITKRPITAADNAAVAKPVFEGTLDWTRDEAGKPVRLQVLLDAAAKLTTEQKAQRLLRHNKISEGMLKAWLGLPLEQYDKLVASRYESQMLKVGIVWTAAELKSQFKLNDTQVALYQEFRAATDRSLDTMARADMLRYGGKDVYDLRELVMDAADAQDAAHILREHLQSLAREFPERAGELGHLSNGMLDRAARVLELQEQGYAPLSRFGRYTVDVVDENGERQYFGLFETAREANLMAMKMRKGFGHDAVTQGTLSEEEFKLLAGITPESLELFGNMLGLDATGSEAQDQAFQEYLRRTKTNRSAMRRLIHRQGIAGYSEDVGRVLASFIYSNARQTSAGLHMGELGEAITDIPKQQGDLKDAAIQLSEYVKNPQEEAQAVRGLLFAQYLGGSIASAFVNMTQPMAVSFPWLSQFGGAQQAATQLGRAAKNLSSRGHRFEADLATALRHAEDEGTVSPQEVHQLMAQARGSGSLRPGDGTRGGNARAAAGNALTRLSLAWGKVFGVAEQLNRRMTFIAAFRIAKAQGMANPAAFAKKAVVETQFVYSKANKMKWGRGAVGATVMTFKTYSIAYLELLGRMWIQGGPEGKRAVMLALAMLMLMGGTGGLPFAEDAEDLADGLAQMMGYNFSSKKAKQEFLESLFGEAGAGFIERGITGLPGMPLDVSGRLGMGNLVPGTGLFKEKTDHTRDVLEVVGPVGDLAKRVVSGGRSIVTGDVGAGLLQMAPAAVRNAAKGADMAARGMYRDDKGYKVLDTSATEAAMKLVGFQPASVAKVQEANAINQQAKNFYGMQAQEIRAKWARGIFEKDADLVAEARADLERWNRKNPSQRIVVSMPDVWRRVRKMAESKEQRIADTAPRAMRQALRAEVAGARAEL